MSYFSELAKRSAYEVVSKIRVAGFGRLHETVVDDRNNCTRAPGVKEAEVTGGSRYGG